VDHELSLKQQLIESLERQVRESRERSETLEVGRNTAFERQLEHFENQRQEYNAKIDKLQQEGLDKDRTMAQQTLKLERQQDDAERRRQEWESQRQSLEKEKRSLADKLEALKKRLADTQDEAMKQKLDLGREQALAKQQVSYSV
jgi:chromosome segregation ATPase